MRRNYFFSICVVLINYIFCSFSVYAGVVISNTRVVYPEGATTIPIKITNMGDSPVLVQNWIDTGDQNANPTSIVVPFTLTPPLGRINAGEGQTLRLSYVGNSLPIDRESIFWLNVLEVPPKNTGKAYDGYLQLAFRSRIKLFFRPLGLKGEANKAANQVTWFQENDIFTLLNPTQYHISLTEVAVTVNKQQFKAEGEMISPNESKKFKFANLSHNLKAEKVDLTFINDYGAVKKVSLLRNVVN